MKQQYKLRFYRPEDSEKFLTSILRNINNGFDKKIIEYPTLRILVAYEGEREYYLPMQQVMMLESLGKDTPPAAQRDLVKGAELIADSVGIKEIYFLGAEGDAIGTMASHHGFEEITGYKLYRMRLA